MGCECPHPDEMIQDDLITKKINNQTRTKNDNLYIIESNNVKNENFSQNYNSKNPEINPNIEEFLAYNNNSNNNKKETEESNFSDPLIEPEDDFSRYLFNEINKLRENPKNFIEIINNAKSNVTLDKKGIKIYKSSVKVAINTGEEAFDLAIDILANTESMQKLIYKPDITVKIPDNEEDIKSKEYLREQVSEMIQSGLIVKSFWKDIIKDPETCFILMVVDDSGQKAGNKRKDILDPENKYIGISSVKMGKSFACYITISCE